MSSLFPRVVLIDDNDDDNFIHRRFLKRADWADDVVEFTSGREAIAALPKMAPAPSVVFVDLNMPELTGFELLDQIRGWATQATGTTFVILTSSLHPDDRQRAERDGLIHAYVEKPLNLATLERLRLTLNG